MKLTYKQIVARNYELVNLENQDYIVAHSSKAFSKSMEIEIYKTDTNDITFGDNKADLIYELLEKATTPEDVIEFCQKYGTLINANGPLINGRYFRTDEIMESNAKTIDISTLTEYQQKCLTESITPFPSFSPRTILSPDHMKVEHFYYYVHTLIMLDELYSETIASLSFSSAVELVKKIENYCSFVETMLSFEYSICDGLISFLTAFPFYLYNIPKSNFINENYDLTVTSTKLRIFFIVLSNIIEQANSDTKQYDTKDMELFIAKVKEIAAQIYADIINFHIKDIPFSLLTSAKFDPLCDSFYCLGDAIIFQKILNLTSSTRKIRCHNETCRKIFVPNKSNQKYCCNKCRGNYHSRKSMRNARANDKNTQNKK